MDVMTLSGIDARYRPQRRLGQLGQAPVALSGGMLVGMLGLVALGGLVYFMVAASGDRYTQR